MWTHHRSRVGAALLVIAMLTVTPTLVGVELGWWPIAVCALLLGCGTACFER